MRGNRHASRFHIAHAEGDVQPRLDRQVRLLFPPFGDDDFQKLQHIADAARLSLLRDELRDPKLRTRRPEEVDKQRVPLLDVFAYRVHVEDLAVKRRHACQVPDVDACMAQVDHAFPPSGSMSGMYILRASSSRGKNGARSSRGGLVSRPSGSRFVADFGSNFCSSVTNTSVST